MLFSPHLPFPVNHCKHHSEPGRGEELWHLSFLGCSYPQWSLTNSNILNLHSTWYHCLQFSHSVLAASLGWFIVLIIFRKKLELKWIECSERAWIWTHIFFPPAQGSFHITHISVHPQHHYTTPCNAAPFMPFLFIFTSMGTRVFLIGLSVF